MKMREALWSAVACYRFTPSQLAGRAVYTAPGRGREQARGIKAAASYRTPERLRRVSPVFHFHGSEESASYVLHRKSRSLAAL